jgi:hypothetical protein
VVLLLRLRVSRSLHLIFVSSSSVNCIF